jgi:hypothetical protein
MRSCRARALREGFAGSAIASLALAALAAVLAWAWQAYFTPAMLLDLANLRLCL